MDTRLLKVFRAVARHNGLAVAARELHLTPSALSHGIKSLETELGCLLFDRVGNKLILTQAGEHLLSGIEQPLDALEQTATSVRELSLWGSGRLRMGTPESALHHLLPTVFRDLRKQFTRLRFLVESGDMPTLEEMLRAHRIDLAIGVEPEQPAGLELQTLFEDELLFAFSRSHPWCQARTLSRENILEQPFILYNRNTHTTRLVKHYFKEQGLEPAAMMELSGITAIKEMVKQNLGVAILAPWIVDSELARGQIRMRPLGPRPLRRRWVLAHLPGRRLGLAEETFLKLCRNHASGVRKDRKDLPAA